MNQSTKSEQGRSDYNQKLQMDLQIVINKQHRKKEISCVEGTSYCFSGISKSQNQLSWQMVFLQCTMQQELCAWVDTDVERKKRWGEKNCPVNCLAGSWCHKSKHNITVVFSHWKKISLRLILMLSRDRTTYRKSVTGRCTGRGSGLKLLQQAPLHGVVAVFLH